ncbi:cytochrome c oxidase assembly protein [Microbacterium gorillae]|uniref:cytochrome c oxidase assembly protein n=1 Tax=Microbacterium gorillae TaxID=1231063 RepID=UPI000ADFE62E|nr:cytochrome c oxidase assembly protein [Microbacterium gorillae]
MAAFVAGAWYLWGVRAVRRRGGQWPWLRTLAFFALGLGSYLVVECGFLSVYSVELRYAFTTRIALLIFVVPGLIALGRPLELALAAGGERTTGRIARVLRWRIIRLFGNAMFATLFMASVFLLFLTPIAGLLRDTPWIGATLGIVVPLLGLVMVVPLTALAGAHSALFLTVEFLLAFVELVIDSIPGLLMRLSESILDGAPAVSSSASWWPSPLHDQHLAGDLLWFIAEVVDVPVLVILLIRWMRTDRSEAARYDDLSDDEHERLVQEHLRGERS